MIERKKILSQAEKLGVLSAADKAGFNLAKVRSDGLPGLCLLARGGHDQKARVRLRLASRCHQCKG